MTAYYNEIDPYAAEWLRIFVDEESRSLKGGSGVKGRALHAALSLPRPKGRGFPRKLMTELQFLVQHLIEHPPRPVVFDGKAPRPVPKVTGKRKTPLASFRGEELLRIRKLQRLSQSEAAAIVGVITKTYAAYEANLLPIPKHRFERMAVMLDGSK